MRRLPRLEHGGRELCLECVDACNAPDNTWAEADERRHPEAARRRDAGVTSEVGVP